MTRVPEPYSNCKTEFPPGHRDACQLAVQYEMIAEECACADQVLAAQIPDYLQAPAVCALPRTAPAPTV